MTSTPVGMRCPVCAGEKTKVRSIGDEPSLVQRAPVTAAIIAINVAVFVIGAALDSGVGGTGLSGGLGKLGREGALFGPLVADGEWYRIVTSGFLHSGLLHLGLNMFLIYILGSEIERAVGRARYVCIYGVSLLAGSLGSMLLEPGTPAVGASGAGYGLMAAFAVLAWSRGNKLWETGIGGLILLNVLFTFTAPNIAIGGHLGGFAGGTLVALMFTQLEERRHLLGSSRVPYVALAVALGAVCFVATVLVAQSEYPALV